MQTAQPATSPLGIVLLVAVIYLIVKSPKKLQTLVRIVVAFVVTVLLLIVPGAMLRMGDPEALGQISALVGLLVAVIAGWWHVRSIQHAKTETPEQTGSKS
jgi:thiol:disulfide interchange protein